MTGYRAPDVPGASITPQFVRDELLTCFQSANREFANLLNQPVPDEQLKRQVNQFVRTVFAQCGVNFEQPTKQGISLAMAECRSNAEKMMGPKASSIIQHHYDEMMKLVSHLPD